MLKDVNMWEDVDKRFIEKVKECIASEKRKDEAFDRMERDAELFQKWKIAHEINACRSVPMIMDLWQDFKVLEKRTRPY